MSISNEIIRVIDDLCEKLGIAIDWTADNILPILKSLCENISRLKYGLLYFGLL